MPVSLVNNGPVSWWIGEPVLRTKTHPVNYLNDPTSMNAGSRYQLVGMAPGAASSRCSSPLFQNVQGVGAESVLHSPRPYLGQTYWGVQSPKAHKAQVE